MLKFGIVFSMTSVTSSLCHTIWSLSIMQYIHPHRITHTAVLFIHTVLLLLDWQEIKIRNIAMIYMNSLIIQSRLLCKVSLECLEVFQAFLPCHSVLASTA